MRLIAMIFNSKMDILIQVPDNKVIIYLFKRVMESYDRNKSSKLYISNLNMDTKEQDLQKHFEEFGKIVSVTLKQKQTGITFGFVEYQNSRDAQKALDQMNHKEVDGKELKVQFAKGGANSRGRFDRNDRGGDRERSYRGDRGGDRDRFDRGPRRDNNSRGCYNCGKDGHFARECPEPRKPRQFDRGDRGDRGFRGGDRQRGGGYRKDREQRGDRDRKYRRNSSESHSGQKKRKRRRSSSSNSRSR